ncbi:E3 ubiquitin-protein ligase RNF181 isoform X2 [Petromyzon marinus]|uniref:E3 ubiquitin-protein ligase RNF181 n=1 Tax=Petromyzon marinus TaxID=7757 RepID=A0AAJ7UKK0_PETMA|nr:E3 ubiquitin-protein ligase RNF181 [Petromyzon marinus]XP_032836419.1 E3 ubiquitin-protein ligase RNF181 [Petromyzon marinus]
MTSYFEEHDCDEPDRTQMTAGDAGSTLMQLARLLLEGGDVGAHWGPSGGTPAPPASLAAVEALARTPVAETGASPPCPVCLASLCGELGTSLPCSHLFHDSCIRPWLQQTNSCPVCRYELPTDDPEYEAQRREKEAEKERLHRVQVLHDSMFA